MAFLYDGHNSWYDGLYYRTYRTTIKKTCIQQNQAVMRYTTQRTFPFCGAHTLSTLNKTRFRNGSSEIVHLRSFTSSVTSSVRSIFTEVERLRNAYNSATTLRF